ncbi:LysR family substrate-binding domain-containing protein [Cellulomonas massiliensis]|uniref:LysR family substrate-binding domain-containing protein n=1 Tax=Cellulomonas massiliensis TaxID=1465811 RepID=UPI0003803DFA|nr:LysR family substrate-binding domain-containing protein [Cellulomonas massiliensis]
MSAEDVPAGASAPATGFRLLLVPGVNPDRWLRVWAQRLPDVPLELVVTSPADAERRLRDGQGDAALLRAPVDRDGLALVPLYTEVTVAAVPKDHLFTAAEELSPADLADETLVVPADDLLRWTDAPGEPFAGAAPATTDEALDLVAAGAGVVLLPLSVWRLHARPGLTSRPVTDAPGSAVGLAWVEERYSPLVEELVGIARGRTAASSRGVGAAADAGRSASRASGTGGRQDARGSTGRGRSSGPGSGRRKPPPGRGRRR